MIWKIETIKDSDEPVDKGIFDNIFAMLQSLKPDRRVSQQKIGDIQNLINQGKRHRQTGCYRDCRDKLRKAYAILEKMKCERFSTLNEFQTYSENRKSWSQNHLDASLVKILNSIKSKHKIKNHG
ncbi:hypothetical protein Q4Q35_11830 [Flavivirga aquimarina]|uniref:Uncharacterized protein n=1 Tax=Flavivirga aquimarina TaxID=2027862 RepID=A0ABT8WBT5_9FLAO|nr:hypothetical protein [Flavivirga aquimarina]MDO5970496.1 hypothetical protein [Flavivirga aquimarina]